jgi:hypothetical protein
MSSISPAVKMGISLMHTIGSLKSRMVELGVRRLLVKRLSPNDNSKNQVYLGGDLGIANVIPAGLPKARSTGTHAEPIFNAPMTFSWLDDDGRLYPVPSAQMILYPQYPEVRFSGFLRGAVWAPSDVMASRAEGRVLFLGISNDDSVIGFAASADHPVARSVQGQTVLESVGVFLRVALPGESADSRSKLMTELCRVSRLGWIEPWRLQVDGVRTHCKGTNCVGVTLESELGIRANGRSEPDFDGWEVKSHTVSNFERPYSGVLTLLTPEPNGGHYVDEGVESFVRRYGYADMRGRDDRLNFGGIHRVGHRVDRTGLRLELSGFDEKSGKLTDSRGSLALVDATDAVAASWSFEGLLAHWIRKHAKAAYVPAEKESGSDARFRYGQRVTFAEGTSYSNLLAALASGVVYLDPGIKVENASTVPRVKRRNQFRVKFADLGYLYHSTYELATCE